MSALDESNFDRLVILSMRNCYEFSPQGLEILVVSKPSEGGKVISSFLVSCNFSLGGYHVTFLLGEEKNERIPPMLQGVLPIKTKEVSRDLEMDASNP